MKASHARSIAAILATFGGAACVQDDAGMAGRSQRAPEDMGTPHAPARELLARPAPARELPARDLWGTLVRDTTGSAVDPLAPALGRPRLLVFSATDCPISQRYAPEIARLAVECERTGVRFWLVYPDPDATAESVEESEREHRIVAASLLDPEQALAAAARVSVTPEAALYDERAVLLYHGRIDDRATALGVWHEKPVRTELRDALAALASAPRTLPASAPAVGCPLPPPRFESRAVGAVGYHSAIERLIDEHCLACHVPGGLAPFALADYASARKRTEQILDVVERRAMPPWKPEPGCGDFADENRVSPRELVLLRQWVRDGAPRGLTPQELQTAAPGLQPSRTAPERPWQSPAPPLRLDLPGDVLQGRLPAPYELAAEGPDRTRSFVIPLETPVDRWVRGISIEPTNARPVHHAILYVDPTGAARRMDAADSEPGFEGMIALGPETGFERGGWSPGVLPRAHPPGTAWFLPAGSDLVLDLHLVPTGKPELVDLSVRLFLADEPPERALQLVRLGIGGINLPAGLPNWSAGDAFVLPVDAELTGIIPHAHNLCRAIRAEAVLPSGERLCLLRIEDWDFAWQMQYRLRQPLALPAGTRVETSFTYDNSAANPRNPNRPPRRVTSGVRSRDEMGVMWLELSVPLGKASHKLAEAGLAHVRAAEGELLLQTLRQYLVERFDADHDGTLDAGEDAKLVAWVRGIPLEGSEAAETRRTFDFDRSGELDESELERLCRFQVEW